MPTRNPAWSLDHTLQHQPIQQLRYSWCRGHRDNQVNLTPGVSDFLLWTKLGPLHGSHWQCMSLILSPSSGCPEFRWTGWTKSQTILEDLFPFGPELHNGMAIDTWFEKFSDAVLKALAESLSQTLRKPKPLPTVWRLDFGRWPILRSQLLLKWLTWLWGLTAWPQTANPI